MKRIHILHSIATLFIWLLATSTVAAQLRVVNSTDDTNDGVCNAAHCSLREAIRAANQNAGPDTIVFNIPGAGPHVIAPIASLPTITGAGTVIDGTSQPGYFPGAIVLAGNGSVTPVDGLEITSTNCAIYGLHIRRFPNGIIVFGGQNARIGAPGKGNIIGGNTVGGILVMGAANGVLIQGNMIGMFPNGTGADPNEHGIFLDGQLFGVVPNAIVGGANPGERNIISGNISEGIFARGVSNLSVFGNIIGLNAAETAALPNGRNGVAITNSSSCTIGNLAGGHNTISGNGINGINLTVIAAGGTRVEGNRVGTDPTGMTALPNVGDGIFLSDSPGAVIDGNILSSNGLNGLEAINSGSLAVRQNTIGLNDSGSAALGNSRDGIFLSNCESFVVENNLVSANLQHGIWVQMLPDRAPANGVIEHNFIGTDATSTIPFGNTRNGLALVKCSNVIVNGLNVVTDNGDGGILISNSADIIVEDNVIGTDQTSSVVMGNGGPGITVNAMSEGILIGSLGAGNVIAHNEQGGVVVSGNSTTCTISGNSMYCNQIAGIDLETGSNDDMLPPSEICAAPSRITGMAGPFDLIEVFRHNHAECGAAPSCQGRTFLGSTIAGVDGVWSVPGVFTIGDTITATATNLAGSTSEFSLCAIVLPLPQAVADNSGAACPGEEVEIIGASVPVNAGIAFEWSGPGGFTSDSARTSGVLTPGDYVLTVQQGFCRSEPDTTTVIYFPQATGSFQTTLCPGDTITINGTAYHSMNLSGTEILANAAANGCDSILSVQVNFFPIATGSFQTTLCPGASITINGTVYNEMNRSGTEILANAAANGCDSILSVQVNFFPAATGSFQTTLCPGASITINVTVYNEMNRSGTEILMGAAANGCDSILSVQINFF
ncbi:MAG: right-handed parallel beta-helix repeat-containing protein, partial [Saprospiraceae bacterium]|nr:right-handed parallel beta-helix repeat-containing protein [Saprospiraceae bacterium]